jgi:hypothetical protein
MEQIIVVSHFFSPVQAAAAPMIWPTFTTRL